jgi:uncharacterized protein YejL (UPF0352 family)
MWTPQALSQSWQAAELDHLIDPIINLLMSACEAYNRRDQWILLRMNMATNLMGSSMAQTQLHHNSQVTAPTCRKSKLTGLLIINPAWISTSKPKPNSQSKKT